MNEVLRLLHAAIHRGIAKHQFVIVARNCHAKDWLVGSTGGQSTNLTFGRRFGGSGIKHPEVYPQDITGGRLRRSTGSGARLNRGTVLLRKFCHPHWRFVITAVSVQVVNDLVQ